MQNRRSFPRWRAECEVLYGSGPRLTPTRALEISEAGIRFLASQGYEVGSEFDLRYRLHPEQEWVNVKAVVRHISGTEVGAEFLNLPVRERLKLWGEIPANA